MFDETAIRDAVEIHARSYRLLTWLASAIERGFVSFDAAHSFTTLPEATLGWLQEHHDNVPQDARPATEQLEDFCGFFGTYLQGSFDLVQDPGRRLYSPEAHCFCPICSWLVDIPRLQPKKVTSRDKKRARTLQRSYLAGVTAALELQLPDEAIDAMLDDPALRETLGFAAYGQDLLRRIRGQSHGAATLALWRQFAWVPQGSPKKKFQLSADAILQADRILHERIAAQGRAED